MILDLKRTRYAYLMSKEATKKDGGGQMAYCWLTGQLATQRGQTATKGAQTATQGAHLASHGVLAYLLILWYYLFI